MIKVAAYLRVSTDGQIGEDKFGLQSQTDEIFKYCALNNYEIIETYVDAGISGTMSSRPALDKMLFDAETGNFKFVIIAKLDRIARDLMLQLFIEKDLLKNQIEIISVAEPMRANDPTGKLFRQIIGAFGEFERERIKARMVAGRKLKAKQGGYAGGKMPLGYQYDKITKKIIIKESEIIIVKRVFKLHAEGKSLTTISKTLKEENFVSRNGGKIIPAQVYKIINNKFYTGIYSYSNEQTLGTHEKVVF